MALLFIFCAFLFNFCFSSFLLPKEFSSTCSTVLYQNKAVKLHCPSGPPFVGPGLMYMCDVDGNYFTCFGEKAAYNCAIDQYCNVITSQLYQDNVQCDSEIIAPFGGNQPHDQPSSTCANVCLPGSNLTSTGHSYLGGLCMPKQNSNASMAECYNTANNRNPLLCAVTSGCGWFGESLGMNADGTAFGPGPCVATLGAMGFDGKSTGCMVVNVASQQNTGGEKCNVCTSTPCCVSDIESPGCPVF